MDNMQLLGILVTILLAFNVIQLLKYHDFKLEIEREIEELKINNKFYNDFNLFTNTGYRMSSETREQIFNRIITYLFSQRRFNDQELINSTLVLISYLILQHEICDYLNNYNFKKNEQLHYYEKLGQYVSEGFAEAYDIEWSLLNNPTTFDYVERIDRLFNNIEITKICNKHRSFKA